MIVSTFSQPNSLRLSLEGFSRQTCRDFELIISDDGSGEETRVLVEEFKKRSPFALKHVWQKNMGYRRARIHNLAVLESSGRVLIFSDGDCVPSENFVAIHVAHCRPRSFCVGGHVNLDPAESKKVIEDGLQNLRRYITCRYTFRFVSESCKFYFYRLIGRPDRLVAYGANISVWREDFFAVNGFDENYDNFGKEDSDLKNRLVMNGTRPISVWNKTWVYHLDDVVDPGVRSLRIPRRQELERLYYYRKLVSPYCVNGLFKK